MSDDTKLPQMTLRYSGIFDWDGLYAAIIDWAKLYSYKWTEKAYKHKVPSPAGAEEEIEWILETKATEYLKYHITIAVHTWDMIDVDVEINGKKRTLTSARVYVIIDSRLEWDWQNNFGATSFLKKLREKYFFISGSVYHWDTLYYRVWGLHGMIKKYFDMQSKNNHYKKYLGEN